MDATVTVVAALIGAVIGSLGAPLVKDRLDRRRAEEASKVALVVKYLVQLQDAVKSVWYRLENVSRRGGAYAMDPDYYSLTSAFILASFLAHRRRLLLDGVYGEFEVFGNDYPTRLQENLDGIEGLLRTGGASNAGFQRYDRVALGESLLVWDEGWRVLSYVEFADRVDQSQASAVGAVSSAKVFWEGIESEAAPGGSSIGGESVTANQLMKALEEASMILGSIPGMPPGISSRP